MKSKPIYIFKAIIVLRDGFCSMTIRLRPKKEIAFIGTIVSMRK